jgi:hypothetical protein
MKKKTAVTIIKVVGGIAISIGIAKVAKNLLELATPEDISTINKVCMGVGMFAVSTLAATEASKQFKSKVDLIDKKIDKAIEECKKESEEIPVEAEA